jgi:sialic acid synthase SpsE
VANKIEIDGYEPLERGFCRVVAEAGVNHNNSIARAIELVQQASIAGAWAIKFQLYKAETLAIKKSPKYWNDNLNSKSQYESFSQSDHLNYDQYGEISDECRRLGIIFFATPFDIPAIAALEEMDVPLYKIASGDITYKSLLLEIGKTGKPVLLSTGASSFDEVERAIGWLGGNPALICPLVCTLTYPTPDLDANFARLERFRSELPDFLIGFSDHTLGSEGGWMVSALGGVCIEKHFTTDKTLGLVPDHAISVDPAELADLVHACNRGAAMRGQSDIDFASSENDARQNARRSLVTIGVVEKDTYFSTELVTAKRPGGGLEPWQMMNLEGKRFVRRIERDEIIYEGDLC